jgi:hypothetical protein
MTKAQLTRLERNVSLLQKLLSDLGTARDLKEFLRHIHQPGWTTPAEFALVAGSIQSLTLQARSLQAQMQSVASGARLVR